MSLLGGSTDACNCPAASVFIQRHWYTYMLSVVARFWYARVNKTCWFEASSILCTTRKERYCDAHTGLQTSWFYL